jgi:cellulose synthase (UDP-forming)
MHMKILDQINKRQIYLLIVTTVLLSLLIYDKGYQSLQGILWGLNQGRIGYLLDHVICRAKGIDKCSVNYEKLTVNFGVYDPKGRMVKNPFIAIDHYFMNWNDLSYLLDNPNKLFTESKNRNRWIMLTIEPWHTNRIDEKNLLKYIDEGKYDHQINRICSRIDKSSDPVFIRWGHEMENVTGRYPWATENPQNYIKAYNHFVQTCKAVTDNAYYVWSPVGNSNLNLYWPGDQNVDYIGISLFIHPEYEKRNTGYIRHFEQAFGKKYERVEHYNKPVLIAEFGITGDEKFTHIWWYNALKKIHKFNRLRTIVYFNDTDNPKAWEGYKRPNWALKEHIFPVVH